VQRRQSLNRYCWIYNFGDNKSKYGKAKVVNKVQAGFICDSVDELNVRHAVLHSTFRLRSISQPVGQVQHSKQSLCMKREQILSNEIANKINSEAKPVFNPK
jgi:23S rRNA maturation mini-RNase III